MRNLDNLVYREETRELIPRCAWIRARDIPWSAQARAARRTREGPSGAPFGQAMTRSHHASHGTAADGIMQG